MSKSEIEEMLREISTTPELMELFQHMVRQARGYRLPLDPPDGD